MKQTPNPAGNKEPKPDKPKKQKTGKSKPKSAKELLKSRNKQKGQLQGTAILKSKSNIASN